MNKAYLHIILGPSIDEIQLRGEPLQENYVEITSNDKLVIGRNSQVVDLQVYSISDNSSISRVHCSILYDNDYDGFMLTDEASTNGTFLGFDRLNPHEPTQLRDGDEIRLGLLKHQGVQFLFSTDDEPMRVGRRRLVLKPLEPVKGTGPLGDSGDELFEMLGAELKSQDEIDLEKAKLANINVHTMQISSYHLFISYSRQDADMMKQIRSYFVNIHDFRIWTDEDLEPGTDSWQSAIEKVIETSYCILVLMSPDAKKSEWVQRELNYAKSQERVLYPVLIKGDEKQSVPLALMGTQYIDLRDANLQDNLPELAKVITAKVEELKGK